MRLSDIVQHELINSLGDRVRWTLTYEATWSRTHVALCKYVIKPYFIGQPTSSKVLCWPTGLRAIVPSRLFGEIQVDKVWCYQRCHSVAIPHGRRTIGSCTRIERVWRTGDGSEDGDYLHRRIKERSASNSTPRWILPSWWLFIWSERIQHRGFTKEALKISCLYTCNWPQFQSLLHC
jgi:hypothetical protein